MNPCSTGALSAWLTEPTDATATRDGAQLALPDEAAASAAKPPEISEMEDQLKLLRAKAVLQRDPAWVDVLDDDEAVAERAAAREIRGLWRDQQLAGAKAGVHLAGHEQRARGRLALLELGERLWRGRRESFLRTPPQSSGGSTLAMLAYTKLDV